MVLWVILVFIDIIFIRDKICRHTLKLDFSQLKNILCYQ